VLVTHARFGNELLRGLVEANQRTIAVAWPRVDGQHGRQTVLFSLGFQAIFGGRPRRQPGAEWPEPGPLKKTGRPFLSTVKVGRLHHRGGRHEFFLHLPRGTGHGTVTDAWVR
jgi:hypothetical protein